MAKKKGARGLVKLRSTEGDQNQYYWTQKNSRNTTERLELKKYDSNLRRHVIFKEVK